MTEPFSNEPLAVDQLPQLHGDAFVSVDRRYIWSSLASLAMTAIVVTAIGVLFATQGDNAVAPAIIASVIVLLLALGAVGQVLESRRLAYQLREHDVSLRSGVVNHQVETIPFSRVQHVSVGRGLTERWLGLATLEVSSAGPDISVPGLSPADADRIKQVVAERAGVDDEQDDAVPSDALATSSTPPTPPSPSPLPPPPWPAP